MEQVAWALAMLAPLAANPEVLWSVGDGLLPRAQQAAHALLPVRSPAAQYPMWLCQEHATLYATPPVVITNCGSCR
jgi:hypothetical protein